MKKLSWHAFTLYVRIPICCILIIIVMIVTGCKIYDAEVELLQNMLANHNISCTLDDLVQLYDGQILEKDPIQKYTIVSVNGNKTTIYWDEQNEEDLDVYNFNGAILLNKQAFLNYFQISNVKAQELETSYAQKNADRQVLILFIVLGIMAVCFQITRMVLLQSRLRIGNIIYFVGTVVNGLSWFTLMIYQNILYGIVVAFITVIFLVCDVRSFLSIDLNMPRNRSLL